MTDRIGHRKRWIKLYPQDCLDGSIRYQLDSAERGVWYDLLNFAALCARSGVISDKDERAYPHSFVANRLNIPLELLEKTLKKCIAEGRISDNDDGIHITNWKAYQSEYDRQKPYREIKKSGFDIEEHIANIAEGTPQYISETVQTIRQKVLTLLDKENPSKAVEVRELVQKSKRRKK